MRESRKTIHVDGKIHRVCAFCGDSFYLDRSNINEAFYHDNKFYHDKCWIEKQINKHKPNLRIYKTLPTLKSLQENYGIDVDKYKSGKRISSGNKEKLYDEYVKKVTDQYESDLKAFNEKKDFYIDEIKNSEDYIIDKEKTFEHFSHALDKNDVYEFILDNYGITIIPKSSWTKISEIYSGVYPGMSIGIPPTQLLDMWKRKMKWLNKVAAKKSSKDGEMDIGLRINYDLSVLISKYDSYLKWLEQQKIIEAEAKKELKEEKNKISISIINSKSKEKNNDDNNKESLEDLVDDIFDD